MVFTGKAVRSRVQVSHLERTADSHANVLENTRKGVMKLPENVTANRGTMDITANGCVLLDCLVQDVPGSVHVQQVLDVILSQGIVQRSVQLDIKETFVISVSQIRIDVPLVIRIV
ncbi:hypothetical protein CAEBREN_17974 [Caenorhabditis brenneri]|uniref:Uncharacterized protein n=1 Tax=Caenorhabditis brenneri TaxID=135651 RepID=G0N5V5_CAEBE|nr:hypothetical protein CAEBREN_17974 [Caenorhabditis brenneri]